MYNAKTLEIPLFPKPAEKKGTQEPENNGVHTKPDPTWVHEIFQGTLTNETRCLNCESVSDDLPENQSINHPS